MSLVCLASVCALLAGSAAVSGASAAQGVSDWGLLEQATTPGAVATANSCAGPTYSAALVSNTDSAYDSGLVVDRDGRWSQPVALPPSLGEVVALACPAVGTCVVGDTSGRVAILHGGRWSVTLVSGLGAPLLSSDGVLALSCPTASTCVAVDSAGQAITDDNGRWARPVTVDSGSGVLDAISCPTSRFCAAADGVGQIVTERGGSWSTPDRVDANALVAISCGSSHSCVAVDVLGDVLTWSGRGWSRPHKVDIDGATLSAVACASATLCFATDSLGRTLRFDGETWAKPQIHDRVAIGVELGLPGLVSISCPSARFCQAINAGGDAVDYR